MVRFRERHDQNLVKVDQTRLNLIDGPVTTRLGEIHIPILIVSIEEYGDTTHIHLTPYLDLKSIFWIRRVS